MTTTRPGRAAPLAFLILLALGTQARASDFFHRLCHPKKCAETERVVLPQQQIEVVRERPSVVVREVVPTRHKRSAEIGVVPLQTVYMPLAMPMVPAMPAIPTAGFSRDICETRDLEFNPLEAAHRAELAALKSERARRELEVTMDAHQRVLQRIAAPMRSTPESASRGPADAAIEQRLNQLSDEIQKLNNRVTAVEKLLIYHDNLLMQNAGRGAAPPGPGIPAPGSALPMVPPPSRDTPSRPGETPDSASPGTPPPMILPSGSPFPMLPPPRQHNP